MFSLILFALFLFPLPHHAAPLEPRIVAHKPIDPSQDEWSSTLSSVSPLIILIGERTTKQVLRNIRRRSNALSLAAAPLGLISVLTSLIRFCGPQLLRSFIGYELEARTVPGIEVTRVNCGGVSAHLSDGYVVRSIESNPASQLVAVSILKGEEENLASAAIRRIRASEVFQREKRRLGIPDGVANVEWCLHILSFKGERNKVKAVVETLAQILGVGSGCKEGKRFQTAIATTTLSNNEESHVDEITAICQQPAAEISKKNHSQFETTVTEITEVISNISEKKSRVSSFWHFTFMSTFDAISEFTTSRVHSRTPAPAISLFSFLSISSIHILALWNNHWIVSVGWLLVVTGYIGIVFGVMLAALLIHSSCVCITLNSEKADQALWNDGMVVSIKNTDSMDTTGSDLVSSPSKHQTLEAVWIKPLGHRKKLLATFITTFLVLAFVGHYLGLRAIQWWASVGELCICIAAAFARSISNDRQRRFKEVKGVKIDKRCNSVGVINTQTAKLISEASEPQSKTLDIRAYSPKLNHNDPTTGERVAYQTAKICFQDNILKEGVLKRTGMNVQAIREGQKDSFRGILATFDGGILVSEGSAFPNARVCLAFSAKIAHLGSPTALLARSIMRQPEWKLDKTFGKGIPLGNVYIFSIQSMMDWWTLSEDRNDLGDLQRNLHWPMFVVNVAFFIGLLEAGEGDKELLMELERVHGSMDENDARIAEDVTGYLLAQINTTSPGTGTVL